MIYLDNAATTKTAPEVVEAMLPYFSEYYGNPSSIYAIAGKSKEAITKGREQIANVLGAKPEEIYFTAGGSESDNWALKATFEAYKNKGNHIITTKIEHHAILHTCEYLEKERGAKITYIGVDENGVVNLDELEAAITPETILISVMAANNEIGTIQPIKEIGRIAKEHNILFHTDAVQAFGQIPINVDECNIDMLSSSGHKINGPKGIGFLYIRKGVKIRSFVHGGAQERKRRAGTENVPGIVGYGVAAERAARTMAERTAKEIEVRDYLINRILTEIPNCRLNGDPVKRLPNNCNISFEFIEGESLLIMLDGLFHHGEGQFLEKTALSTLSLLYIGLPFAHFIFLRSLGEGLLWTVMVGTWASDTFAYFGGRMWGKTPLAPTVSPKKTREGALCGFLGTLAVIYLIGHTYLGYQSVRVLILALLVGFFAPLGDLVESIMKRCCKIKDSGTFFPGHGGVLDRCDSLIFSIPIAYYFVEFFLF